MRFVWRFEPVARLSASFNARRLRPHRRGDTRRVARAVGGIVAENKPQRRAHLSRWAYTY